MRSSTACAILTLAIAVAATSDSIGHQPQASWPAPVQTADATSPVRTPEDEMRTFALPPGYRVELVASEPMVQEPILIDWDPDGRLWVVELLGYMQDLPATTEREPTGRISVLEDLDDDGKMDKKTVFLDGLILPRALKVLDRGVLVGEPPNLWFARDTNGDLRADTKDVVVTPYGRADANVEHNANGLLWALDNWMHTSETDVMLRLKNGAFEKRRTLSRGQWGNSQDDAGRIYRNSNESVLHVDLVPTPYYARNTSLVRTRGSYESLSGAKNEVMTVWPARATPGVNRGYQTGVLRADSTLAAYTAAAAPTVYRGTALPSDLRGNVFVVDPAGNLVSRIVVNDDGTTLRARKAYEQTEFMTSTDERFRPVYLSDAPDGTLYVVDMYRGIIQHRAYVTEYLRDQILSRQLEAPIRHGRIYRIVHETRSRGRRPSLSTLPPSHLVDLLAHENGWHRDTAQRLLVERGDRSVVATLAKLVRSARDWRTRLHALWTLDGLDAIQSPLVIEALADPSRDVRVSALRIAERWLGEVGHPIQAAVLKQSGDRDWAVRRQLAATLGALPESVRIRESIRMLDGHGMDPVVVDAVLSGVAGSESTILDLVLASGAETPSRAAAVTMLTATIVRGGDGPRIARTLALAAEDARPAWQRRAVLHGGEVALLGAVMPGGGGGRGARGQAAQSTEEVGARGGPGGAPAFPRAATGGRGRGAAAPPPVRLPSESALVALAAADTGEFGKRATALLARLTWPGKPGEAPAAAPLTAEEQQRFEAGRQVYQSLCAACHQPDGRGQEKLAPSLIGSPLAVGAPDIAARIVLGGKEGPTGLMPPLGSVLSDEQIAAALTYIRREWGHSATPIVPEVVKGVRAASAGRTRPWTAEELSQLQNGSRGARGPWLTSWHRGTLAP
jgi:mono/diheme cytochrome c family protein